MVVSEREAEIKRAYHKWKALTVAWDDRTDFEYEAFAAGATGGEQRTRAALAAAQAEIAALKAGLREIRECLDDMYPGPLGGPYRLHESLKDWAGQIHVMDRVTSTLLAPEPQGASGGEG